MTDPLPPPHLDRDIRQRDIIPPNRLAECKVTVVGVGAVGRQVALQLAAVGVPWLQLIDFDLVETVNLAPQGFLEADLGRFKVDTTAEMCLKTNSQIVVETNISRFRKSDDIGNVLFNCVDSIDTRRHIWQAVKNKVDFYTDARMNAEVIRVLTASCVPSRRHYPTSLFSSEEAQTGACTAKSTIFTANIAAGFMLEQFTRYLRRISVDPDILLNLLTMELTCLPTPES